MEKKYILFDLDGTLTDSYEGIINALVYSLSQFGIEPKADTFRQSIGPPLHHTFTGIYGMTPEESDEAVRVFRGYYDEKAYKECALYDGVEDMLHTLSAHGKKLMLATAKPEEMAVKILEHFDIAQYFCFIAGTTYDTTGTLAPEKERKSKTDVINYVLKANDIKDPEKAVMVGDRDYDMISAKKLGLQTVGVLYGFGSGEELLSAGADYLAKNTNDIVRYIIDD